MSEVFAHNHFNYKFCSIINCLLQHDWFIIFCVKQPKIFQIQVCTTLSLKMQKQLKNELLEKKDDVLDAYKNNGQ